jgi:hypothetical protein
VCGSGLVQSIAGSWTAQNCIVGREMAVVIKTVGSSVWDKVLRQRRYLQISHGTAFTLRPFLNVAILQFYVLIYARHYNCQYIVLCLLMSLNHSRVYPSSTLCHRSVRNVRLHWVFTSKGTAGSVPVVIRGVFRPRQTRQLPRGGRFEGAASKLSKLLITTIHLQSDIQ